MTKELREEGKMGYSWVEKPCYFTSKDTVISALLNEVPWKKVYTFLRKLWLSLFLRM